MLAGTGHAVEAELRRILDRYIFTELFPPFFISLAALCFVMLTKELLRLVELLVSQGVGLLAAMKAFLYLMPSFLVLTLPIAAIIASITAFSRLSYDKELIAMRAAGLSLLRLSKPVLVFSVLVFGLTLALSQWGQPWTNISLKKLALSVLRDQLTLSLEKGVFNEPVTGMVVYVADHQETGHAVRGIFISDERNTKEPRLIVASEYQVLQDADADQVALRLFDGTIHTRPSDLARYNQMSFSTYDLKLSLDSQLYDSVEARPTREQLVEQLNQTNWQDKGALRRLMESYKDLAFPIAALLLGMLGVPVGVVTRRSGRMGGFAIGVMVVVVYYIFNVLCDFFVTARVLSPFAGAWAPNVLFLAVAVLLFYHVNRH